MTTFKTCFQAAVLATFVSVLGAAGLARAQMGGGPPPGPSGGPHEGFGNDGLHPLMMLLRNAALTTSQQDQVHALMTAHRAQVEPLLEKMHGLVEQISDRLVGSPEVVSVQDLTPLHQQIAALQEQIDEQNLDTAVKIRAVLTADQRRHLAEVHEKVKSLRAQMDALVHPDGPPPPP